MIASDLIVEVRDAHLNRVGAIFPRDMKCTINPLHNDVGTWTITVAVSHACAETLSAPGSGIIATDLRTGVVILSGPSTQIEYDENTANGGDITHVTVSGVSDNVFLQDRLAWSDPLTSSVLLEDGELADAVNVYDEQTGPSETLMHHYVGVNMGPRAPAVRRLSALAMGNDGGRGASLTSQPRYQDLLGVCQDLAKPDDLGFRIQQTASGLAFETRLVDDVSKRVRLAVRNRHLKSAVAQLRPPTVTRAIVSASDSAAAYFLLDTSTSLTAEQLWNRRIEQFVSADSSTGDADSITASGKTVLADGGDTKFTAQITTLDSDSFRYGVDYELGDKVTVEVNGTEVQAPVTGFVLQIDDSGRFSAGVTVGDVTGFDTTSAMVGTINRSLKRINALAVRPAVIATNGSAASTERTSTFAFSVPSAVWHCAHNLGTISVDVITTDEDGRQVIGDVVYDNSNSVSIHWYRPRKGTARVTG